MYDFQLPRGSFFMYLLYLPNGGFSKVEKLGVSVKPPRQAMYHSTNIFICPRMTVSPPIRLCTIEHRT